MIARLVLNPAPPHEAAQVGARNLYLGGQK